MRRLLIASSLLLTVGVVPLQVFAQTTGNRGSTGSSGTSGFGSSGFGTAGSTGGFGSSGFGTAGSTGGFGQSSGGGLGSSGMGGSSGFGGQQGLGGQQGGQQGGAFLGANNNPNNFLGRSAQGQQGAMGMNGMNQMGNNGNRGGNRGGMNTMNSLLGNNGGNSNSSQPAVRPRQVVALEYSTPKGVALQSKLQSQMTRLTVRKAGMENVLVTMNVDGEAVLRGAVKAESDSKLIQNMLRLEPGVRSVRNELTFPAAPSETP